MNAYIFNCALFQPIGNSWLSCPGQGKGAYRLQCILYNSFNSFYTDYIAPLSTVYYKLIVVFNVVTITELLILSLFVSTMPKIPRCRLKQTAALCKDNRYRQGNSGDYEHKNGHTLYILNCCLDSLTPNSLVFKSFLWICS